MTPADELKQIQRQVSRKECLTALQREGIAYHAVNHGSRLIIRHNGMVFDLWPGNSKWNKRLNEMVPGNFGDYPLIARTGKGIESLMQELKR